MMHFADSPKVSFVLEFALCKQLEQLNALATGRCRLLFSSECKELAMHHFFWDALYAQKIGHQQLWFVCLRVEVLLKLQSFRAAWRVRSYKMFWCPQILIKSWWRRCQSEKSRLVVEFQENTFVGRYVYKKKAPRTPPSRINTSDLGTLLTEACSCSTRR